MVILLFLRNFWATFIPGVTVPLALLGSFAAMYLLNFSLDNLSLMALTIAVGFVVDDAIVVVENIYRHVENGEPPFEAALNGSREIGFTVLSISFSLIAVFIPLLLMGGIIGRLFREFALTVTASIAVSALVSLTLAPMLCSRFMRPEPGDHGRIYRIIEAGFDAMLSGYRRTLDVVLRHQAITLGVFFATMALTGLSGDRDAEGLLPDPGHRPDHRRFGGRAGGFAGGDDAAAAGARRHHPARSGRRRRSARRPAAPAAPTPPIPAASPSCSSRATSASATASQIIDRLRPQLAKVPGANLFLQPTQDITVGGRIGARQLPVHAAGRQHRRADRMVAEDAAQDADLPELADVASDLLANAPQLKVTINRDQASRFGISPQTDRRHAQRRLSGSARSRSTYTQLNTYWIILEILPELQTDLSIARSHLREIAADRRRRAAVGAGRRRFQQGRAASDHPSGAVPGRHADLQPARRRRARRGGRCHQRGGARHRHAGLGHRHLPGQCPGVPDVAVERAGADRGGARRRLHHSRHALRELHPSADDPVDAAVGRRRRAARAQSRRTWTCR